MVVCIALLPAALSRYMQLLVTLMYIVSLVHLLIFIVFIIFKPGVFRPQAGMHLVS